MAFEPSNMTGNKEEEYRILMACGIRRLMAKVEI